MNYSTIISRKIVSICKERKITINKPATMSGITQSTVDGIVRGTTKNPKLKTLHKLAIGLSMTAFEFLDFPKLNNFNFDAED